MPALCSALAVAVLGTGQAHGDGELVLRGAYYLEKATRVVQPMLDARLELDDQTELQAHTLIDAITSASAAAGAAEEPFTERRYEAGAGVTRRFGEYQCGLSGRFSNEPDYRSIFGAGRCQAELGQRNTTFGLAMALGRDNVTNEGAQDPMDTIAAVDESLVSTLVSASVTQLLSPVMLAGLTYDLTYQDGFLENPYRRVPVGGGMGSLEPERVPETRLRHAVFASVRGFVPATGTGLIAGHRVYLDDWGLVAHTPEVRAVQEIIPELEAKVRYRFHWQSAADFYEPRYATGDPLLEPYLTDDVKLSRFTSHTLGFELETALAHLGATGTMRNARLDLVFEYVVQNNRFGNAIATQLALVIPLEY